MKFQQCSLAATTALLACGIGSQPCALAFSPSSQANTIGRSLTSTDTRMGRNGFGNSIIALSAASTSDGPVKEGKTDGGSSSSPSEGSFSSNPFSQWMPQQKSAKPSTPAASTAADASQEAEMDEYTKGFIIIGFITLLNASTNPLWHGAFANGGPPPLLLNAAVAVVAWAGLAVGGPMLDSNVDSMKNLASDDADSEEDLGWQQWFGGMELGFWKFLGTTSHLYGLSMTSANHGAFLIQLTTLIVPVIQGLQGEKIPRQIQAAVGLALLGVYAFTQDPNGAVTGGSPDTQAIGDVLCIACAFFYSFYDIQTFKWGRVVPRKQLVTTKIATQAVLSISLCAALAYDDTLQYFQDHPNFLTEGTLIPVVLWSGLIVNALATFLQVGGMQAVGPTRAQTIFASQPLWSSALAYAFLGETIGLQGAFGGTAFLFALYLAITAPKEEAPKEAATEGSP